MDDTNNDNAVLIKHESAGMSTNIGDSMGSSNNNTNSILLKRKTVVIKALIKTTTALQTNDFVYICNPSIMTVNNMKVIVIPIIPC